MILGPFDGSMLGNGKGVVRVRRCIIIWIIWIKKINSAPSFMQYRDFTYKTRFIGAFLRDNLPRIKDGAYIIIPMTKKARH